jgi:CheY-like chemotaxis protein
MVRGWGMRPTLAESGAAALQALDAAAERKEPFLVVLLDGMMPEMDGLMTAREIKRRPALGGVRVILLTSADRLIDDARCEEHGLSDYLVKPVHSSDLQAALVAALAYARPTDVMREMEAAPVEGPARPLRVLLAEDNPINQMLAVTLLKKQGHSVEVARDGRDALAALERESFDVVLMDVQMPNMDGFEATALIREKEKRTGEHIPIVALTANAMKGNREECLAKGMDDYLGKPIQVKELLEVLARTVRQPVS